MTLYVGNLNYKISDNDLSDIFEEFGEVTSAKVIVDRETGRSKGFGFVEMANDAEAREAIDELDGSEVDGRTIKVNKARPKSSGNKNRSGDRRK